MGSKSRTILKLGFLHSGERDEPREALGLALLLVDLGPQLVGFGAELFCVLLEGDELVTPQVRLRHQEVQPARETADLGLEVVAGVDEGGRTLADGVLDELLRGGQLRRSFGRAEYADSLQERGFLELKDALV